MGSECDEMTMYYQMTVLLDMLMTSEILAFKQ